MTETELQKVDGQTKELVEEITKFFYEKGIKLSDFELGYIVGSAKRKEE